MCVAEATACLLAVWLDFLNLTDTALSRHLQSVETLFMNMDRVQKMLEPTMAALSSLEQSRWRQRRKTSPPW